MEQTWVTIYSSILIHEGRVGYSYYFRHNKGHKSYSGVFKAQITDKVHAEICSIGAAIKAALKTLKGVKITGLTVYTDCSYSRSMLEQFRLNGNVTTSDINSHYVIGLNQLLGPLRHIPLQVHKIRVTDEEWMKASLYRKIGKLKAKGKFGSLTRKD